MEQGVYISAFVMTVMLGFFWKEAFNQVVQMYIYLRHSHCLHHHNTQVPQHSFFAPLTLTVCGKIMRVALAQLAVKDIHKYKSIYSKMHFTAYTKKPGSSFLSRTFYRGLLCWLCSGCKNTKPPTLVLNQTNKPCQEDHIVIWTFKSQTRTFAQLCPVISHWRTLLTSTLLTQ